MVGEVRDPDTAHIAIEAALTGHLVLSTLHAGSACGVLSRLLEMGVQPYLLTSGLKGILNQRLVRRTCPACRRQTEGGWEVPGCPTCFGTGYSGRMLLAELVTLDAPLRQAVLDRTDTLALERCVDQSGKSNLWTAAAKRPGAGLDDSAGTRPCSGAEAGEIRRLKKNQKFLQRSQIFVFENRITLCLPFCVFCLVALAGTLCKPQEETTMSSGSDPSPPAGSEFKPSGFDQSSARRAGPL